MDEYTFLDLAAQLAGAASVVLPWVGGAVALGLSLVMIYIGIRAAIDLFRTIAEDRRNMAWVRELEAEHAEYGPEFHQDDDGSWYDDASGLASGDFEWKGKPW